MIDGTQIWVIIHQARTSNNLQNNVGNDKPEQGYFHENGGVGEAPLAVSTQSRKFCRTLTESSPSTKVCHMRL